MVVETLTPAEIERRFVYEARLETAWRASLVILGLAAAALILLVTTHGIGLGSDSAEYIRAARNLAAGNGLAWSAYYGEVFPMTHYPPFFPVVLAGFETLGVDALLGARLLNAFAFGLNVLLVGLIVRKLSGSQAFALLGSLLAATSIFLIQVHSWAMSEALFLSLALLGLLFLGVYLQSARRRFLAAASLAFGLAYLTRYAGLSLIAVGVAALLLASSPWRRRLVDILLLLLISLPLNLAWMARNAALTGYAANRAFSLYFPTRGDLRATATVILTWFAPPSIANRLGRAYPAPLVLAILLAILIGALFLFWLDARRNASGKIRFLPGAASPVALFLLAYPGLLIASTLFSQPRPDLNNRIFSPLHVLALILIAVVLAVLWRTKRLALQIAALAFGLLFLLSYVYRAEGVVSALLRDGQGFSSREWQSSETIQAVRDLSDVAIYTNRTGVVYLLTGRSPYSIPLRLPGQEETYRESLTEMRQHMAQDGAVLVLFDQESLSPELTAVDTLTRGLVIEQDTSDGALYIASRP